MISSSWGEAGLLLVFGCCLREQAFKIKIISNELINKDVC
jgi:hypothetical protein